MSKAFKTDGGAQPVTAWLLERMVGHGLATGLCRNTALPVGLLEVVETLGISGWKAELVDPEKMLLVAEQVATAESLGGAGLMRGVAQMTVNAYMARRAEE
jgi:ribosomal protein S12 methylthiotransferase accessory factor YcaO